MASRSHTQVFEFDSLQLADNPAESRYRQLEIQIREAIRTGRMTAGSRLPSTRSLAETLNVSRNTVLSAYQQLISEGYLESQSGSGTRVTRQLPESYEFPRRESKPPGKRLNRNSLSTTGRRFAEAAVQMPIMTGKPMAFRPHLPALEEFPVDEWNRLSREQARWSEAQFNHCDPQGYEPLRESIAEYMGVSRGVTCSADQVVVTSGGQQCVHLIHQMLLNDGDHVWVEEPGNAPANQLLEFSGSRPIPVPVDAEGIDLSQAPQKAASPRLIYVTPGGQWPLAVTMSLARRLELLQVAKRTSCWILEDDYNGEYRYSGRPHPALASLDTTGRTIYMGSFSKLLFPAIRLGFLVVPQELAQAFAYARWILDRYSSPLPQMVLQRFIESGQFLKHIRRMRILYRERRDCLFESLNKYFGDQIAVSLPESGMHLFVKGVNPVAERRLMKAAKRAKVEYHSADMYSRMETRAAGMILGFAAFDTRTIRRAVRAWSRDLTD